MKVQELNNTNVNDLYLKLSDNSITVKDSNNKTRNVINNVQRVKASPFSKQVELNVKFKGQLNKYFDRLYITSDNKLYYFINNMEVDASQYYEDSKQKLDNKVNMLSGHNVQIIYSNVNG